MNDVAAAVALDAGMTAELPAWDLSDLYAGPDDPDLDRDLTRALEEAKTFRADFEGKLAAVEPARFGEAIVCYEAIFERLNKAMSFAQLYFAADMADASRGRFLQTLQERYNAVSAETLFFTLELNKLSEVELDAKREDPVVARYRPWLADVRQYKPHQLSDEVEAILHDKSVTGARAWSRLFDQTIAELRFDVGGDSLTLADTLNMLDNPDAGVRRTAAKALGRGLGARAGVFTLIVNTLAKDKEVDDKWRKYPHPVSYRNLTNKVDDAVVDALVSAIRGAYAELAHRYYRLKAGWFGRDSLDYWDRNAPLPGDDNRRFSWEEGRGIVLDAFGGFDGRMAELAERFFVHSWIDGAPRPGKDPGAFCHPVVPSAHPYVLMNYYGRSRDVMTLAHELGHGVHQLLAAEQGMLMADTPLTLAETASVFGEMLVFRAVLDRQHDPSARRRLLAGKVESMLNTVVRQTAFHEFEQRVHGERPIGELSSERLGEIWLDVQRESLGPVMRFDDEYQYYWAYIPHFIHSPFYVYAYAFGDCLVNSLYQVYQADGNGFGDTYIDMLRAGGTRRHDELLAPFGLVPRDPAFWRRGVDVIVGFIDELEAID
ncbi:MAG: M3 family oligoendopeptidase [Rhodospirillales bacterium]|jgi:oligoendopeptidase F|nr:M3 family oligoendopeptidase [Rhodospirillales bacterium]